MLLILAWVAGSIDAISFLGLGHVFPANMTGNTVLLGLALGLGQGLSVARSVIALGGFGLGAAIGALIVEQNPTREEWPPTVTRAIVVEWVILALFTVIWLVTGVARGDGVVYTLIALSSIAMGLQSVAVLNLGVAGIVTTYITGTLTSMVIGLVGMLRLKEGLRSLTRLERNAAVPAASEEYRRYGLGIQSAVLFTYLVAAVISGFGETRWPLVIPVLPLAAVALVVICAFVHRSYKQAR